MKGKNIKSKNVGRRFTKESTTPVETLRINIDEYYQIAKKAPDI